MRRAEIVTASLMAFFSVYLMWKSAELPIGWINDEGPGGGAFSFWLSAVMLICCIWTMFNWYHRSTPPSKSKDPFMDAFALRMFLLVGGAVTIMIGLVHFIGMYGSIPLVLLFDLRVVGSHSSTATILISLAAPIIIFFFFDVALRIVLPKGYLEPLFFPLYSIFL